MFEELGVKQQVFAEIEKHVADDAILATNTSSLSVDEIGSKLAHPERLVGFHFFNPVAVMPLIEVVKASKTNDVALSTAMVTAAKLRKNAVITKDSPGFVVNRVLAKLLGEAMHAVEQGTPFESVVEAQKVFGFPMDPFVLARTGRPEGRRPRARHPPRVRSPSDSSRARRCTSSPTTATFSSGTARARSPDTTRRPSRSWRSTVRQDAKPYTVDELRVRIEDGLADEIHRMLEDDVVHAAEDIDLCMLLGAGWPFQMGGATPYLDRVGASERVFGDTFHHPLIKGVS